MSEVTRSTQDMKDKVIKTTSRLELLLALDKFVEICVAAGINEEVLKTAKTDFHDWEDRYVERY
jgi:uncharacterized protein YeeX (DUF496 family)